MSSCRLLALLLAGSVLAAPAAAQKNTQQGAVLGGLTGAIAGGLIGDHNHKAGIGAVIGGAVGTVTGAVLGNAEDEQQARARYRQQQLARAVRRRAVSIDNVLSMIQGGVSDEVIIGQIQQRGVQKRLEVPDIIFLHQQGVSERVITALQRASVPTVVRSYAPPSSPPVVVQERVLVPRYVPVAPSYYYWSPHHHHRRGPRAGFSVHF